MWPGGLRAAGSGRRYAANHDGINQVAQTASRSRSRDAVLSLSMSRKDWYDLWQRLEHRLSDCIIDLRPLAAGCDPKPMPQRQSALWRRAVLKRERALKTWMQQVHTS